MSTSIRAMMFSALLATSNMLWAAAAPSADLRPPTEQYRAATLARLGQCQYSRVLAQRNAQAGQAQTEDADYRACSAALRASAPAALKRVLQVSPGKALKQAIRSFHATFLKGLDGLEPLTGESDEAYQSRQLDLVNAINIAWEAVENNR